MNTINGIDYYAVIECANILDVSIQTARGYIQSGKIKALPGSRQILVSHPTLMAFKRTHYQSGSSSKFTR